MASIKSQCQKIYKRAISTAKTRQRDMKRKLVGSLTKFFSKSEKKETLCQVNVDIASASTDFIPEAMEILQ